MRADYAGTMVLRVNMWKRQTRPGLTLGDERRAAHGQRGLADIQPAYSACIRRYIARTTTAVRCRGAPQRDREAFSKSVAKKHPDRRECLLVRCFRERSRGKDAEVMVMMFRILIVVALALVVPEQLVVHTRIRACPMLQSEMPDGE